MRTSVVLVLIGLLTISSAFHTVSKPRPFDLDAAAIDKDVPAAKAISFSDILTLFQSKTLDGDATSKLTDFLEGLKDKLRAEHQQHLELYAQQKSQCNDELAFRDSEVAAAQTSLAASNDHRELCESEERRASDLRDLAATALEINKVRLDTLNSIRAGQIALYNSHKASLAQAIQNVDVALQILAELELEAEGDVPASFIQIVNTLLALTVKTGHSHKVLPIYNALIEAHSRSRFDVDDIAKVNELLNLLKANAQESDLNLDAQEAIDKQNYEDELADITLVHDRLANQVALSDVYIGKMSDCVTQEVSIETMAQGKIERNTDLKAQAQAVCDDADAEFQQAEKARNNQIELLGQLESAIITLENEYQEDLLPEIDTIVNTGN